MTHTPAYQDMRAGRPYAMPDEMLIALQIEARRKLEAFHGIPMSSADERRAMLHTMLGSSGSGTIVLPVMWEYGKHIYLGERYFINFDCIFLDGADIRIGTNAVIGPRVQFLTSAHPTDPDRRGWFDPDTQSRKGTWCINRPIAVGENCWIGAGAIIMGGVTIGAGTTIGAGSVVTRDMPAGVVAAGNPCRVIRNAADGPR